MTSPLDELIEHMKAFGDALTKEPDYDVNNPWPWGSPWWHKHNEIWRRRRSRNRFSALSTKGAG